MARCYFMEGSSVAADVHGVNPCLSMSGSEVYQSVAVGTAVQTDPFERQYVMVEADAACHVLIGVNPTAVATAGDETGVLMTPGVSKVFHVKPGHKASVIAKA